jgi:hypothetical protein
MVGRINLFIGTNVMYELVLLICVMVIATIILTILNDNE